ncbi:hypothetical protein M0R45_005792 [Rubus argutus]|uniref:Peptidase A1 domain-containing protein n=1 Tax=Rubus argutus TaxID=59490 RepID=A0AAW1YNY7_RUBAR
MAATNPNSTFCHLHKHFYTVVVATIFFLHLVCFSITEAVNINSNGFSAHLIRKNSPNSPLYNHKNNRVFRRLMGPDTAQSALETDRDSGEHLMKFSIGTPPFDIYAIADTGSTLLWTQCQPCKSCFKMKHAVFDPKKSSTYRNITCFASECRLVDEYAPPNYCGKLPQNNCIYGYQYMDSSYSLGVLAKEVVTLTSTSGKALTLKDIVIGCGRNNSGALATENEMGIVGLGRGNLSFVSQIGPYVGGKRFSYCLVPVDSDPKIESKINFGNGSEVSGTLLKKGNMVVDSGTPLTYVPQDFFDRVVAQLSKALDPKLEAFIVTDPENVSKTMRRKNLVCFGIANSTGNVLAPDGVGYYGNNLQGNFLIGFDLDTKLVSFKPTNCIKMTSTSSGGLLHPFSIFSTCLLYLLINWSF